jgi:hypothetical protein
MHMDTSQFIRVVSIRSALIEIVANKTNTEPQSRYTNRHKDFKTKRSKDRTTYKIEKTDILPTTSLWIKSYK